jgi:GMP synthase-like glutamine amidotransferase
VAVVAVVAVLHHLRHPFLGHAQAPLEAAGLELDQRFLREGDELPTLDEVDGLLILGGEQSALGDDPLLAAERDLLHAAVEADVPVLGVCLGGQLLARALGGRVRHIGRMVEWRDLSKLPAAAGDPLFGELPEPVPALHFNEDVFDAPPGADVLVGPAPSGTAAFRVGRAWALQYHPDADAEVVDRWIAEYARDIGDPTAFREASEARRELQARASAILFGGFARVVLE